MTPAVPTRRFTPIVSTSRLFELDYPQRVGSYGTYEEAQAAAKEEAAAIVEEMKDEEVKKAFEYGEIREIVALIAYLNSLK